MPVLNKNVIDGPPAISVDLMPSAPSSQPLYLKKTLPSVEFEYTSPTVQESVGTQPHLFLSEFSKPIGLPASGNEPEVGAWKEGLRGGEFLAEINEHCFCRSRGTDAMVVRICADVVRGFIFSLRVGGLSNRFFRCLSLERLILFSREFSSTG